MAKLGVADLASLFALHFVVVLGDDHQVGGESKEPARQGGDKVVSFFLTLWREMD